MIAALPQRKRYFWYGKYATPYEVFCAERDVTTVPATPTTVAAFIASVASSDDATEHTRFVGVVGYRLSASKCRSRSSKRHSRSSLLPRSNNGTSIQNATGK